MQREIKFEYGFESVNGIIKKVYHLHEIPNIHQKCDVWNILPLKYVRQYTGLKDKNGVEIFEGDICIHTLKSDIKGIISFFEGSFIIGIPVTCHSLIHFNCPKNIEITGNIHDNPELI